MMGGLETRSQSKEWILFQKPGGHDLKFSLFIDNLWPSRFHRMSDWFKGPLEEFSSCFGVLKIARMNKPPPFPIDFGEYLGETSYSEPDDFELLMYMSLWYGTLFVLAEGWRELSLTDPEVDRLLDVPTKGETSKDTLFMIGILDQRNGFVNGRVGRFSRFWRYFLRLQWI